MSEQKGEERRTRSLDDTETTQAEPLKSSSSFPSTNSSIKASSSSSRRTGRRRDDEFTSGTTSASTTSTSVASAAVSAAAVAAAATPSSSARGNTTSTRRIRTTSKRSEDDEGTVSSKQSSSASNGAATSKINENTTSKDDDAVTDDGSGKPRSSAHRRTTRVKERRSTSWDEELSTNVGDTNATSAAGSTSLAFGSDEFGSTFGGAFGDAAFDTPTVAHGGATAARDTTAPDFATSSFPTALEMAFEETDFGATDAVAFNGFAFDSTSDFVTPQAETQRVWEKTPHDAASIPPKVPDSFTLSHRLKMTQKFHGSPIANPLNGNLIFAATAANNEVLLHEVDPSQSYMQVASVRIVTAELRALVATKYNATITGVGTVWNLAAGGGSGGGTQGNRLQIAAIVDLKIMEAATCMRVVLVWTKRGSFVLEHVTTPPSGGDFACDVSNFQVADGLLFVSGSSPKGGCILVSKPALREAWSANFLAGSGSVCAMAVTPSRPHIVVALADGSVTVWTYKSALVKSTSTTKTSKRWLFPLCRLDFSSTLLEATPVYPGTGIREGPATSSRSDVGYCTHLAWISPGPSLGSMPLLAVAFENGFAVFHVDLPLLTDDKGGYQVIPEPTQSVVTGSPMLTPIAAKRWQGKYDCSYVAWQHHGPHADPCLAVLLHDTEHPVVIVVLCAMNIPTRNGVPSIDTLLQCQVVAAVSIHKDSSSSSPTGLLPSNHSIVSYSKEKMWSIALSTDKKKTSLAFLDYPVTSELPGLSSTGDQYLTDSATDSDGILYIYSTVTCERLKCGPDGSMLGWSLPARRLWLCRSVTGDTHETSTEEKKEERGFGDSDETVGGANSEMLCELVHESLAGLTPIRIVRCRGKKVCAVLFRASFGVESISSQALSFYADTIALMDFETGKAVVEIVKGRDIAFFPGKGTNPTEGLLLTPGGLSLDFFTWLSSRSMNILASWRPLLGVNYDDYIESFRASLFVEGLKVNLVVFGKRLRDDRVCIVTGEIGDLPFASETECWKLLPNIVSGRSAWLDEQEEAVHFIGLQGDEGGYRNFAVATSFRVLILSSALTVTAETRASIATSSLAPLGSFAVLFSSARNVRYLCCLEEDLSEGAIVSARQVGYGHRQCVLMAARPDRVIFCPFQSCTYLQELKASSGFRLPAPETRPVLMLEPMVANAVCIGERQSTPNVILRTVIEKFGRKVTLLAHSENEGIGPHGAGITAGTYEMLNRYGLKHAASWLLTGTVKFDRATNTKVLPPWLPVAPKSFSAMNADAMLHILSHGDSYFSEYVKSPDRHAISTLPRQSDIVALLSREYAHNAIRDGKPVEALKMLDISGSEWTDSTVLQLSLMLEKTKGKNAKEVLRSLSGKGDSGKTSASHPFRTASSLAALSLSIARQSEARSKTVAMSETEVNVWMKPLAPSLQRSKVSARTRQQLFTETDLASFPVLESKNLDSLWSTPCNESKHVWSEGPRREKENLLLLDSIGDWLGRRRLSIIGREGMSAVQDRGETTLADILNRDDDSFRGADKDTTHESAKDDGWIEGVGEGRTDEANLSAYFRMSEGDNEDPSWKKEGFLDLSPYQNRGFIVGDLNGFILETSTSNVDEGEKGKVKSLFDLVFPASGQGSGSSFVVPAARGGSLDVGVFHTPDHETRQKASVEFWFYLPSQEGVASELVLARRTYGPFADSLDRMGLPSDKDCALWELALKPSGELEFRTCSGSLLRSSTVAPDISKDEKEVSHPITFNRWNHVCLVLSSKGLDFADCAVRILVKGVEVGSKTVSMRPKSISQGDVDIVSKTTSALMKSHMVFGAGICEGFRLTELRIWACERSADDTQSFLYEYLTTAEQKKKFKVKIATKNNKGMALGKGLGLAPPKGALKPVGAPLSAGGPSVEHRISTLSRNVGVSLAPPPKEEQNYAMESPKQETSENFTETLDVFTHEDSLPVGTTPNKTDSSINDVICSAEREDVRPGNSVTEQEGEEDPDIATTLWDTAVALSQQLRPSAAAALIRGPPATRHYGGNRGGLPDFSGVERFGVGGIAVCGSEKTIVFRDNEDPPALTYPIGASGAIVSDQMDDEGSEFLCCFLAKEGRMVVFELRSRTVVVELQMTTKLNFWRYLQPEAAGNTLCFMLVTPVGGFHWMPLQDQPRPHQVWKRGPELQGKKVVCYEEGGSNGLDGEEICSRVGLVLVTRSSSGLSLEGWLVPVSGDSKVQQISDDLLGACLCQPLSADDGPFLPLLVLANTTDDGLSVNVFNVVEPKKGAIAIADIYASQVIDESDVGDIMYEPPSLAMGPLPEVLCVSLANIIVVIVRRKGFVAAFELEDGELNTIAMEKVDHFVIDAVMRYSPDFGGAEIVMLLSDDENPNDGRIVSFCFRSAV